MNQSLHNIHTIYTQGTGSGKWGKEEVCLRVVLTDIPSSQGLVENLQKMQRLYASCWRIFSEPCTHRNARTTLLVAFGRQKTPSIPSKVRMFTSIVLTIHSVIISSIMPLTNVCHSVHICSHTHLCVCVHCSCIILWCFCWWKDINLIIWMLHFVCFVGWLVCWVHKKSFMAE